MNSFTKSLIQEQDKLIQLGVFKASKNQALLVGDSKNAQEKGNQRGKENQNTNSKTKYKKNHSYWAPGSNKNKKKEVWKS